MFHPAGFILTSLSFGLFFFFPLCWNVSKSLETAFYFAHFFSSWECPRGSWAKCGCFLLFLFVSQCVACERDLGGSSSGAEVRIRNNQLYCNDCYLRFKCKRANQGENFLSFTESTGSHVLPWTYDLLPFQLTFKLCALELQALGISPCRPQRGSSEWVSGSVLRFQLHRVGCGAKDLETDVTWGVRTMFSVV